MLERQSIARNLGWLALGNVAVKPFWFVFLLLTARLLGSAGYGQFMFAISLVTVAAAVLEGGLDILTVREISTDPRKYERYLGHTVTFKLLSGLIGSAAVVAITVLLGMGREVITLVFFAAFFSVSNTLLLHFRFIFRSFEVFKYEALSVILEKTSVIALCGAVLLMHKSVVAYMIGYASAYCITCLVTLAVLLVKIGMPKMQLSLSYFWSEILKPALPFAIMNLFIIIYFRAGTIMLKALTGQEELVGYYNAGYRLVESFMLFPTIIVAPIYPVISRIRDNPEEVRRVMSEAMRALLFVGVSIALPILIFRQKLTLLLFGEGYRNAVACVGILALTMIPISIEYAAGTLVAALGRQGKSNWFVFATTVLNLVLNYFLIREFSAYGASWTTVLTETFLVICNLVLVRDYIDWHRLLSLLLKFTLPPLLVGALMLTPIGEASFSIQIVIAGVVMLGGYFLLKLITVDDLKKLLHAVA